MKLLRPSLDRRGVVDSASLPGMTGRNVRAAGLLAAVRTTHTKKGGAMEFLTLEDEKGIFEVTLFPRTFRRFGRLIEDCGPYLVEGRVEDQYGALSLNARRVVPLAAEQYL